MLGGDGANIVLISLGTLQLSANGVRYEGEWNNNRKCGQGVIYYGSKNWYRGGWSHDQKNGHGVMCWLDTGEKYTGQWRDGKQHGHGEHIWYMVS